MTRAQLIELKGKVIAAKKANPVLTIRKFGAMFCIGKSSVERYLNGMYCCPTRGRQYETENGTTEEQDLIGTSEGHE
jgi:hypothetical protein